MVYCVLILIISLHLVDCKQENECENMNYINNEKLLNNDCQQVDVNVQRLRDWIISIETRTFLQHNNTNIPASRWRQCAQNWDNNIINTNDEHDTDEVMMSDGTVVRGGAWSSTGLVSGWTHVSGPGMRRTLLGYYHDSCLQDGLILVTEAGGQCDMVAEVEAGHVSGAVWCVYPGQQGALYTRIPRGDQVLAEQVSSSLLTGDSVTWVYPDLLTTLTGHFVAGRMLSALETRVTGVTNIGADLTPQLTLATTDNEAVFRFDPSTDTHMTSSPMIRDPLETKYLAVSESSVPGAGVGVFTVTSVSAGTIVGYFNGVHLTREEVLSRRREEQSLYIVEGVQEEEMLDIIPEYRSWSQYHASTGHLINHDSSGNVDYSECQHPRFGSVLCVVTKQDLKRGDELFVTVNDFNKSVFPQ